MLCRYDCYPHYMYIFPCLGQVKFHPASGSRSSLVLRDTAEPTSYWEEERQGRGSEIIYYRNYDTKGYLGMYETVPIEGI